MSAEQIKHLTALGAWAFKGILSVCASLIVYVVFQMKEDVRFELNRVNDGMIDMRAGMKLQTDELHKVSDAVIRIDGRVETNTENIQRHERELERLEIQKENQH